MLIHFNSNNFYNCDPGNIGLGSTNQDTRTYSRDIDRGSMGTDYRNMDNHNDYGCMNIGRRNNHIGPRNNHIGRHNTDNRNDGRSNDSCIDQTDSRIESCVENANNDCNDYSDTCCTDCDDYNRREFDIYRSRV